MEKFANAKEVLRSKANEVNAALKMDEKLELLVKLLESVKEKAVEATDKVKVENVAAAIEKLRTTEIAEVQEWSEEKWKKTTVVVEETLVSVREVAAKVMADSKTYGTELAAQLVKVIDEVKASSVSRLSQLRDVVHTKYVPVAKDKTLTTAAKVDTKLGLADRIWQCFLFAKSQDEAYLAGFCANKVVLPAVTLGDRLDKEWTGGYVSGTLSQTKQDYLKVKKGKAM